MVRRCEIFIPAHYATEVVQFLDSAKHAHSISVMCDPWPPSQSNNNLNNNETDDQEYNRVINGVLQRKKAKPIHEYIKGEARIIFRSKEKHLDPIIHHLGTMGVGTRFGTVDIISLEMTKPRLPRVRKGNKRKYRYDDRKTFEEIYTSIDKDCHLTFDYLVQIIVASMICGVGLLSNSATLVVASMLVSPLMAPILAITFGLAVDDKVMFRKGMRNEFYGMLLTFFSGVVIGAVTSPHWTSVSQLVTFEMTSRGSPVALLGGIFVAIPSGVGVAVANVSEGLAAITGVAISASLLPPIVNSGMNFMFFSFPNLEIMVKMV